MNIGYFNARGINDIEHWFKLEIDELRRKGYNVKIFTSNRNYGCFPNRTDVNWMDFNHYHFAQVADLYKRLGVPFCISPHANDIFVDEGATLKRASEHPNCKFVTYQSFYHKKKFEEWGIEKPLVYLPMCCRTELFTPPGICVRQRIIAGGRLIPKKGLHQLSSVDNLTIFGDGQLKNELKKQLPKATFVGHLNGEQLRDLMNESWLYLFPAMVTPDGDSDGIPNTIKESMLMRLQVIASPIAGIPELENITLFEDWNNINSVIKSIPKHPNWKGEQEIRKLYDPKVTVNMLLDAIGEFNG